MTTRPALAELSIEALLQQAARHGVMVRWESWQRPPDLFLYAGPDVRTSQRWMQALAARQPEGRAFFEATVRRLLDVLRPRVTPPRHEPPPPTVDPVDLVAEVRVAVRRDVLALALRAEAKALGRLRAAMARLRACRRRSDRARAALAQARTSPSPSTRRPRDAADLALDDADDARGLDLDADLDADADPALDPDGDPPDAAVARPARPVRRRPPR